MHITGSPARSIIVFASLVALAVPTHIAPVAAQAPLVQVEVTGFGSARRLAAGDLNGDGHPDLLGAFEGTGRTHVSVALSDGLGGFPSKASYFSGPEPSAVAVGYMNADEHLDVVVTNRNGFYPGGSVAILLGDGTGALLAPISYLLDNARAVAVGKFNGDATLDVAVVNGNNLTILANDGLGNLSPASTVLVAPGAISVDVADFDQDSNLDVAVVSYSQVYNTNTSLTTFRGNGNGTLSGRVDYKSNAQGGGYFSLGTQFIGIAIGNLNGDLYPDIVVTSQGHTAFPLAAATWVMMNNGAGGFPSPVKYSQPIEANGVAIGDLNADGTSDVVTVSVRDWSVQQLFNDGTGALSGAVYTGGVIAPEWVVLGDFNNSGPGTLDMVVSRLGRDPVIFRNGSPAVPCAAGSYSATGTQPCTPADAGSYVGATGATSQEACAVGTFSSTTGSVACTPAPAGSFVAAAGSTSATSCATGSYSATEGSASCALAPTGYFVAATGSTSPTACVAGTYADTVGAEACTPAPAGSYVSLTGAASATACAAGSYSAAAGSTSCALAPAGSFVPSPGATAATACAAGSYSAVAGSSSCTPALAGSFVATVGATSASLCPAGTYSDTAGSAACTPAPAGFFVASAGATSAAACAPGYGSAAGATSCYALDNDGDGVNNDVDAYPNSNMNATVTVGACGTGVTNQVMPNGATFNDLIAAIGGANHGAKVSTVSALSNSWKSAGLISGRDHGAIVSCTAKSK